MDPFAALFAELHQAFGAGRYDDALVAARRLLSFAPDRADALNGLGSVLLRLNRGAEALPLFLRVRRLVPQFPVAVNLGDCLRQLGRHHEALATYVEARRHAPNDAMLLNGMMLAHVALGQQDQAIEAARAWAQLIPDNILTWQNLGLLLRDRGRLDEAQFAFDRAVALSPDINHRRRAVYNNRTLMARRHLAGRGIEIGAFCNPTTMPEGASVRYVDAYDTAELYRRFPEHAARMLVEVDVVENGETLASFAAASEDFIVANHMLEHCEDPIGTLANMLRVLRPGGVLFLAVPDKRFTFDELRPLTSFEHLLRDHHHGPQGSRMDHFREWARLVKQVAEDEVEGAALALHDTPTMVHYHVWDHDAFVDFLTRTRQVCGLPFTLVEARASGRYESVAVLRRTDQPATPEP
jgi:tetratricopeptide (TPR) repeat protein